MKTRASNVAGVRRLLRALSTELGQLNHRVGARAKLRDVDLACLDVLSQSGPLSPGALAQQLQVHPATMTGVLDRLEADGWIARDRDPDDRRAVVIRIQPAPLRQMMGLYGGMNGAVDQIAASYDAAQLATITEFLERLIAAGKSANKALDGGG
jgi:DNA-binding MarR family transcriptional regulator